MRALLAAVVLLSVLLPIEPAEAGWKIGKARVTHKRLPEPWPRLPLPDPMPSIRWGERCPSELAFAGCFVENRVYVASRSDLQLALHELGHAQEGRLDQGERNRLARAFYRQGQPWLAPPTEGHHGYGEDSPSEEFADTYAWCILSVKHQRWREYVDRPMCRLLSRALRD